MSKKRKINLGNIFKTSAAAAAVAVVGTVTYNIGSNMSERDRAQKEVQEIYGELYRPDYTDDHGVTYTLKDSHVLEADYADQTLSYNFSTETVTITNKVNEEFNRQVDFEDWDRDELLDAARDAGCNLVAVQEELFGNANFSIYSQTEFSHNVLGKTSGTEILNYTRDRVRTFTQTFARNYCPG